MGPRSSYPVLPDCIIQEKYSVSSLTVHEVRVDNSMMVSRKVVCFFLLLLIPLSLWFPMQPGQRASSDVSGPRSALRAYRAALQLRHSVAVKVVIIANIIAWPPLVVSDWRVEFPFVSVNVFTKAPALRC